MFLPWEDKTKVQKSKTIFHFFLALNGTTKNAENFLFESIDFFPDFNPTFHENLFVDVLYGFRMLFHLFPKFLFGRVVVLVVKVAIEGQSMRPRYETKYLNRFVCSTHIPLQFVVVVASAAGIVSLTVSLWKENGRKKKVVSRDGIRLRVYFLNFGFMLCTVDGARQLQLATGNLFC